MAVRHPLELRIVCKQAILLSCIQIWLITVYMGLRRGNVVEKADHLVLVLLFITSLVDVLNILNDFRVPHFF